MVEGGLLMEMKDAARQYVDIFRQNEDMICRNAPTCMNSLRAEAYEYFSASGFPSPKDEDYRHTDVPQIFSTDYGLNLGRLKIPVNPSDVFQCDVPNMSTSLYFIVNDTFYAEKLPKATLPEGVYAGGIQAFAVSNPEVLARYYGKAANVSQDAVCAFNTMFAQDGFVLYVPQGIKVERPIQLVNVFRTPVDMLANRRILVVLEADSSAKLLVCDHIIDDVNCLSTQVVEIFAGEGVFFDYYDLEETTLSTVRFSSVFVEQAAASNVLVNGITLNNGRTRNNYHVRLNGVYAETTLCGLAIQDKAQQVDTYTHITHSVPFCKSNELFKNVLDEKAIGAFSGRILVKEGADKTEAYQTNRNMCMTREAKMYSKPQLEIYADDVKCSHGMSTGQLDEQAVFYMQSRGISQEEARMMLSIAFTADVLENIRLDALKDRLRHLVEKRFRGELAQCGGCSRCR